MNRFHVKQLVVLFSILSILIMFECVAAQTASFSGRVIDEAGNPVEEVNIILLTDIHELMVQQILPWMSDELVLNRGVPPANAPDTPPFMQVVSKSDKVGTFAFTNVVSHPLMMLGITLPGKKPNHGYEFIRFKIGGVTFRINRHETAVPFSIAPGTTVKDIEITIKTQRGIRVQVITADGAPLKNAMVKLKIEQDFGNGAFATDERDVLLNEKGQFTAEVYRAAELGPYTVNVTHGDLTAKSASLKIEPHQSTEVVLQLLPVAEQEKLNALSNAAVSEIQQLVDEGIWVINPENRHAYKRIRIKTLEEARQKAEAQGAYLVAINDAAEQQYLLDVLGFQHDSVNNFWIGLKAGATHWDSGEPVTFTRFLTPTQPTDTEKTDDAKPEKDDANILLWGENGMWTVENFGSPTTKYFRYAILEKENLIVGMPKPDDATEKR